MKQRFQALDGWRGVSILLVLAAHLLPLGAPGWGLNKAVGAAGMAVFFVLSGFLITHTLIRDDSAWKFLVRRFMRIVPLAWLVLLVTFCFSPADTHDRLSNFLFYANWPPMGITHTTSHYWSLCVEIQFYALAALLMLTLGGRALWLLPALCLAVTANRMVDGVPVAINTYYRLDEILVGAALALIFHYGGERWKSAFCFSPLFLFPVLVVAAHPIGGALNYFRPYIALLLVGSSLFAANEKWWQPLLRHRILLYIASISYALYVIHGGLRFTWLGEGDDLEKYAKRPLLLAATFLLAHLSTRYYEAFWIRLGKRLTAGAPEVKLEQATKADIYR